MKAYDIISRGFALAGESFEDWTQKNAALCWLNIAVAESVVAENLIRAKNGRKATEGAYVADIEADVEMDDKICRTCLPYYIAMMIQENRENGAVSLKYRNLFAEGLQKAAGGCEQGIVDLYGGTV